MRKVRHIVFDVGNVLILWEREIPYRSLIPDEAERRRFLEEVCSMEWHSTLDAGAGVEDAISELSARFPHQAELIRAYRSRWLETIPGAIDGTVAILEALVAKGHDVTALTNFNQDLFRVTRERYPFLDLFRGVTVSGEARMIKPDPAIYTHHTQAFGLEPAATLFFDDVQKNIDAARTAGWNAELFIGAEKMRGDLSRYGIAL
jgi:HAD superfamily hydrolase (TIGR01509 family)